MIEKNIKKKPENYFVFSAQEEFWPENVKILFAGKWCLNPFNKTHKEKSNFEILKTSIYEFENQRKEINYCDHLYEKLIEEITDKLNKYHKISWSKRSWKMLIGLWLNRYIAIINDRLNILIEANKNHRLKFKKINFKDESLFSYDLESSSKKILDHEWNEKLIRRLQKLLTEKNFDYSYLNNLKYNKTIKESDHKINFYQKLINKFWNFFPLSKNNKYFFNKIYIGDFITTLKLFFKLREFPVKYFIDEKPILKKINFSERKYFSTNLEIQDLKEKIIRFLLPETIPTLYVEGFNELKKKAFSANLPENKIIFTCNAWRDTIFKFWIADQTNKGNKLIYGQHGGGYGMLHDHLGDKYELDICDRYLTWGQGNKNNKKIYPNIAQIIIHEKRKETISNDKILIIPPTLQYYYYRNEVYNPNNIYTEFEKIRQFILNLKNKNEILFKAHPIEKKRKFSLEKLVKNNLQNVKIINSNKNLDKLIENSQISIFFYLSTAFLKNLALNKPSIFVCDDLFIKRLKKDSLTHFQKLIDCKIVFLDAIEASKFLNKSGNNIIDWWNDKNVQTSIQDFSQIYMKKTPYSLEIFKKSIVDPII